MLNTIRQDYEYPILNLLKNTRQVIDKYHPNIIWWVRSNEWLFQYNTLTSEFLCHNTIIWSVLKKEYETNDIAIQYLIINVLDRKFDIGVAIPICTTSELNEKLNKNWHYQKLKILSVRKLKNNYKNFMFDEFVPTFSSQHIAHQCYPNSSIAIFEQSLNGEIKCYEHFWQYFKDEYDLSLDETKRFLEESYYKVINKRVNIVLHNSLTGWVHG